MYHDQIEIFSKIMGASKRIAGPIRRLRLGSGLPAQPIRLELIYLEEDPIFARYGCAFAAHLRYPLTQCGFSLQCKEKWKAQKPLSALRFDYASDRWKLSVYDENDYSVLKTNAQLTSIAGLFEMLATLWHIENLHELDLEIDGVSQLKLPFNN